MRAFFALYREGFKWLCRDKIFIPVVIAGIAIAVFANVASDWSVEDFQKVLFDIGMAGFRLTGGAVALMWGARMIHDALTERSIEPRLAAPIHRGTWFAARFTALASVLLLMGVIFAACWQVIMFVNQMGQMNNLQSWTLGFLVCEWLVLAALSMTFAAFSNFAVALFASAALWIAGLVAPLIAVTRDLEATRDSGVIVDFIADVWNFQRFNLIDQLGTNNHTVDLADLMIRLSWAGSLLVVLLTIGMWRFSERDLG